MRITKIMTFDSAHMLPNEECYGKCRNLHGHTYKLEVTVDGPVTSKGWVMNFKELKEIMKKYVDRFDHAFLNDLQELGDITTAERMVEYLWFEMEKDIDRIPPELLHLSKIRLWETPTSYAELEA